MENKGKNELLSLKRNALMMGLCGQYKDKWDGCCDKRALVNMALDSNGIEFMADSIAFGWGLSKEYLQGEFGEFMNGLYQCREKGYTSEMYIGAHGVVSVKSTLVLVGYCKDLEIHIPEHTVCRIYVCGGSRVRVENMGECELFEYGADNIIDCIEYDGSNLRRESVPFSKWNNYKEKKE